MSGFQTLCLSRVEEAVENAVAGCSCSEALLRAYAPHVGLEREKAMQAASGLAGGVGLSGNICGVVTTSVVILGLLYGPAYPDSHYERQRVLMLTGDFLECFKSRHGSLECGILCGGLRMDTREGARAIRESGIPLRLIRSAAEIIESLPDKCPYAVK